jgi:hypothetical protein
MIKNPKLLAVCLIIANVFFFGAYAYVTDGEVLDLNGRALSVICYLGANSIGYLIYLINTDEPCHTSSTP